MYQDGHRRHNERKRTADETGVTSRDPLRHMSNASNKSTDSRRPAAENMLTHVTAAWKVLPTLVPGIAVSKKNARVNLLVVRNPKMWSQGDEDGGAGKPGIISSIDEATDTCAVYWYESGQVHDHYKIDKMGQLCKPCGDIPESLGGNDGLASAGMAQCAKEALRTLFGGRGKKGHQTTTPIERIGRRNSKESYAEKTQTAIIFDWDDTLFPTTFVRHGMGLSIRKHLKDQNLRPEVMSQVRAALTKSAGAVDQLLRLADKRGKVVIVTLAKKPWVTDSCRYFYPGIGELIEKLNIQIVYARDGEQIDYSKVSNMAQNQFETFWAETKGMAISEALGEFYSQYEGQSWKNVISLGDSHFERYGTMAATMQYAAAKGLVGEDLVGEEEVAFPDCPSEAAHARRGSVDTTGSRLSVSSVKSLEGTSQGRRMSWEGTVGGQKIKVRTKTFKMLDDPTDEELIVQLRLLHRWFPLMVDLDDGFDIDLNSLEGEVEFDTIEKVLRPR